MFLPKFDMTSPLLFASISKQTINHIIFRRQTTEEREAERQAAQRLINQLQQEALAHTPIPAPDAICLRNASLFALHSLQARLQNSWKIPAEQNAQLLVLT